MPRRKATPKPQPQPEASAPEAAPESTPEEQPKSAPEFPKTHAPGVVETRPGRFQYDNSKPEAREFRGAE